MSLHHKHTENAIWFVFLCASCFFYCLRPKPSTATRPTTFLLQSKHRENKCWFCCCLQEKNNKASATTRPKLISLHHKHTQSAIWVVFLCATCFFILFAQQQGPQPFYCKANTEKTNVGFVVVCKKKTTRPKTCFTAKQTHRKPKHSPLPGNMPSPGGSQHAVSSPGVLVTQEGLFPEAPLQLHRPCWCSPGTSSKAHRSSPKSTGKCCSNSMASPDH